MKLFIILIEFNFIERFSRLYFLHIPIAYIPGKHFPVVIFNSASGGEITEQFTTFLIRATPVVRAFLLTKKDADPLRPSCILTVHEMFAGIYIIQTLVLYKSRKKYNITRHKKRFVKKIKKESLKS